jgi:hypothetical protein
MRLSEGAVRAQPNGNRGGSCVQRSQVKRSQVSGSITNNECRLSSIQAARSWHSYLHSKCLGRVAIVEEGI